MKNIVLSTLILIAITSLFSCKKFLDIKPQQQLLNDSAMATEKDLKAVLDGAYDGLQSTSVAGGDLTAFSDLMADDFDVLPNRLSNFGTSEIYNGQTSVQIGTLSEMWKQHYSVINRVNNVIYAIDSGRITGSDFQYNKNAYKGEALFIRAYCNFNLLQMFALPYNVQTIGTNTQLGIVLRTRPSLKGPEGLDKARSTVEECYTAVIHDLKEAYDLLITSGKITSIDRVSAMAAKALLARVYFTCGRYNEAAETSSFVINSAHYNLVNADGRDSTKLVSLFFVNGNSTYTDYGKPETIWQLVNTKDDNSGSLFGYYFSPYFMKVKADVVTTIDSLDDHIVRNGNSTVTGKSTFIKLFTTGDWYIDKYRKKQGANYVNNIILLRLSEMYLIKSEALSLATSNVSTEALDAFNKLKLRNYGIASFTPENTSDLNEFLEKVRHARRIELMSENGDRYTQLKRLGLPLRDGTTNYDKYVFKIPQEEMSSNNLIIQNP